MRKFSAIELSFPSALGIATRTWHDHDRPGWVKSEFIEIDEAREVRYALPREAASTLHCRFSDEALQHPQATFCIAIRKGRVWGAHGAVISPDNRLLSDLSEELNLIFNEAREHSLFREWKLPQLSYIEGSVAVLAVSGGDNYYHWMFDVLPRIGLLSAAFPKKKVDFYVVNDPKSPFQFETLARLGISEEKVIGCTASTFIEAEELLAPSLPGIKGNVTRRSCEFLRQKFGPSMSTPVANRRLYIGRENSIYRRVIADEKLAATLHTYGFEHLALESMTVAEQAAAFAEAEVVVGPHGAGFTNLVFCRPGVKVLEIFSPHYVYPCYWTLASQAGLAYYYVLGAGKRPADRSNPDWGDADIRIDYPALHKKLESMGIERLR